jgi:hypothetical protein
MQASMPEQSDDRPPAAVSDSSIKILLTEELRFLTFRPLGPAIHTRWRDFLAFGLCFTWLAGIGRYWDNPRIDNLAVARPTAPTKLVVSKRVAVRHADRSTGNLVRDSR